ncbi:hypothetical protein D910_12703 [Dendroctonus ponderosae]|nr:hypothetical protein D910_12703 [Dendroctonus ponderosae]
MSVLDEPDPTPPCICRLKENKPKDFSICDDEEIEQLPPFEMIEDPACPAKRFLATKYNVDDISEKKIERLHKAFLPNVNGNWSLGTPRPEPAKVNDLYVNIVPNIYERLDKDVRPLDSFKKYSVSEDGGTSNISNSVIRTESENASDFNGSGANASDSVIKLEPQNPYQNADNSEKSDIRTEEQQVFREWYECIDRPSYNNEPLRILPYCILD